MKALFKTLFGDWLNLGFVALVMVIEVTLVRAGYTHQAGVVVPAFILAGVSWLSTR